jgi:hypothetical protein
VTDRALQLRRAQRHASGSQGSVELDADDEARA